MIGRLPRPALGELLLGATLLVVLVQACLGPRAPAAAGDELDELRQALDLAERAEPLARVGCAAIPDPDQRRYCDGALDGVHEVTLVGRPLLEAAEACRAKADAECVASSLETARGLLRKLRSLQGGPSASSSSASAAPAASSATPERTP